MKEKIILITFFVITILCHTNCFAAGVRAQLDRTQISTGDSFHIIFTIDNVAQADSPDLTPLLKDFQILGKSQSTNVSVVNGKANTETQWIITLLPKHTGNLEIPVISFGDLKTEALKIQVSNIKKSDSNKNAPIFISTSVNNKNPYVQSEVLYTVRLYYATRIDTGSLSAPETSGAVITRLEPEKNYQAERDGKLYQVVERRYVIYPDKSGILTIEPPIFTGIVQDKDRYFSKTSDLFGTGLGQSVRLTGDPVELSVKSIPQEMQNNAWLPTKSLTLKETWSIPSQVRVGDPITRTVEIQAQGLPAEQLPALPTTKISDMNSYNDKPITENYLGENHITGKRIEKVAYIATQPGKIVLPEIVIPWWDTANDQMKLAKLPTKELTIMSANENSPNQNQLSTTEPVSEKKSLTNSENKNKKKSSVKNFWPWLTGIFFLIWIMTLLLWWFQRRYKKSHPKIESMEIKTTSTHQIKSALKKSCESNDPKQTKDYLLQWAQLQWPHENPKHLTGIIHLISNTEFSHEIEKLDHTIYAGRNQNWSGETLWNAFLGYEKQKKTKTHSKNSNPLPPLYPE